MSTLKNILGLDAVNEDDGFPVAGRFPQSKPTAKPRPENARKKLPSRVGEIMGSKPEKSEVAHESIIPSGARRVGGGSYANSSEGDEDGAQSVGANRASRETLMSPTLAIVAPDATPDAYTPISPSLIPQPAKPVAAIPAVTAPVPPQNQPPSAGIPAMTAPAAPVPAPVVPLTVPVPSAAESEMLRAFGIPNPSTVEVLNESSAPSAPEVAALSRARAEVNLVPGAGMPDHKDGNVTAITDAFRRFGGVR